MMSYDTYVFILCFIVLVLLTVVFSSMILMLMKMSVRLIRAGTEDKRIYKQHLRAIRRGRRKKRTGWFRKTISVLFACVVVAVFGFTVYLYTMEHKVTTEIPTLRVVYSNSMAEKHKDNKYLVDNDLNNQFDRFDLVVTYQLPKEEDLKLYDIVVYEIDDVLLIHRIVGIEEPNEKHPDHRLFKLQGDNVKYPDTEAVEYTQMKAIYRDQRVPFLGSFVMFLQSPAGYMCFILLVIEMIASPMMTKKILRAEKARLKEIQQENDMDGGVGVGDMADDGSGCNCGGVQNIIIINHGRYDR